jgi:ABC-type nitrate/sulfonate/bicarbonate transport system substrate-binding protein
VSRMLETRGVSLNALETVRLPEPVMVSALESGAIDAGAASEPVLSRMAAVGSLWLSGQHAVPDFQWGVIMFGERLLVRERETAHAFMRAYQRGVTQYRLGKTDRNVAIIAEGTGETVERTRAACWIEFTADSHIDWSSVEGFQAWANAQKFMDRIVTRDQAVDTGFVK